MGSIPRRVKAVKKAKRQPDCHPGAFGQLLSRYKIATGSVRSRLWALRGPLRALQSAAEPSERPLAGQARRYWYVWCIGPFSGVFCSGVCETKCNVVRRAVGRGGSEQLRAVLWVRWLPSCAFVRLPWSDLCARSLLWCVSRTGQGGRGQMCRRVLAL